MKFSRRKSCLTNPKRKRGCLALPRLRFGLVLAAAMLMTGCEGRSILYQPNPDRAQKLPSQVTDFHSLFANNCSGCHGAGGLQGPAPPIGNPLLLAMVSQQQLADLITHGRHGTLMPPFVTTNGEGLTPEQVGIIAAGMKSGKLADPAAAAPKLVPPYRAGPASSDPADVAAGGKLFANYCAGCHGESGRDGPMAGALNDPAFLALISDHAIRSLILTGRPDLKMVDKDPMPSFIHLAKVNPQNAEEKWKELDQIVAYIASWRKAKAQDSPTSPTPSSEPEP